MLKGEEKEEKIVDSISFTNKTNILITNIC